MGLSNMQIAAIRRDVRNEKAIPSGDALALLSELDELKAAYLDSCEIGDKLINFISAQGLLEEWSKTQAA